MQKIGETVASFAPFDAIGISCGGPLDEERGMILSPPNLPGWDAVPIRERRKAGKNLYIVIKVPASETYMLQDYHLPVYHAVCAEAERRLFEPG